MRSIPRSTGWLAPGLLCVAACSPTLDWRDTRFPEAGDAEALFPCKPDRVTRPVRLAGEPVTFALASCSAGALTFAFAHVELAEAAHVGPALDALRATAAANLGGTVEKRPSPRVPGAATEPSPRRVALSGRRPDGTVLHEDAVFFAHGRRIFQVSVVGAATDAEAADTFLSSLRLPD